MLASIREKPGFRGLVAARSGLEPCNGFGAVTGKGATMTLERTLEQLDRLVGSWLTEATHPALPGVVVHGTVDIEWLEGKRFLIHRARTDHPEFPDSISIIGNVERDRVEDPQSPRTDEAPLTMHYFDSRGIFRDYEVTIDGTEWRIWRNVPSFRQRFIGTLASDAATITGLWQLGQDDERWDDDLRITYRRRA
jgi:hypothetical protein